MLSGPLAAWEKIRDRIRDSILLEGLDRETGVFTRAFGERDLDASGLLIPHHGLLSASDPRVVTTVDAVRRRLSAGGGLLYRYRHADGLPGEEGAFTACSFWLARCLALQGRIEEACEVFDQVVRFASDLGLMSEEIDPVTGRMLGNHPQAFTHLALIRAAVSIARAGRASKA